MSRWRCVGFPSADIQYVIATRLSEQWSRHAVEFLGYQRVNMKTWPNLKGCIAAERASEGVRICLDEAGARSQQIRP